MSHVVHTNGSRLTLTHMSESRHTYKSRHTCEWVTSCTWMGHVSHLHILVSHVTHISHVTPVNESRLTGMSQMWMSHIPHSHTWVSHVTPVNESRLTQHWLKLDGELVSKMPVSSPSTPLSHTHHDLTCATQSQLQVLSLKHSYTLTRTHIHPTHQHKHYVRTAYKNACINICMQTRGASVCIHTHKYRARRNYK